ncbi:hypothetical protein BF95_09430 [Sphingobium sp. Ant17]|nr:hypothetical protein BF95_09430 [Sphingobium sp. Ant17]
MANPLLHRRVIAAPARPIGLIGAAGLYQWPMGGALPLPYNLSPQARAADMGRQTETRMDDE